MGAETGPRTPDLGSAERERATVAGGGGQYRVGGFCCPDAPQLTEFGGVATQLVKYRGGINVSLDISGRHDVVFGEQCKTSPALAGTSRCGQRQLKSSGVQPVFYQACRHAQPSSTDPSSWLRRSANPCGARAWVRADVVTDNSASR